MKAYRLSTESRLSLERKASRTVINSLPVDRYIIDNHERRVRFVRNPFEADGDYLLTITLDPASAVEPPDCETLYVTGGEHCSAG